MSFFHPWAILIGALAIGIPLAVHWLTRPRPVKMPLSTIRFVLEAVRQRRARHRLRDLIVLGLRVLAVAALALAVARPYFGESTTVVEEVGGQSVRVVVLDVSQSMGAAQGGVARLEHARSAAADALRYRSGLRANLIVAAAHSESAFDQPSSNYEALREELSRAEVLPQRLDVNAALQAAALQLAPAGAEDQRKRELVVISDFQRSNWTTADFSLLPVGTKIELKSIATNVPLDNIAVLQAGFRGWVSEGRAVPLEVEIGNFTATDREVTVEVVVGTASFRMTGNCPAEQRTTLTEPVRLRQVGWQTGSVRLLDVQDALPADDVRPLSIRVRRRPLYALVTRQSAERLGSSSHFLRCALAPEANNDESSAAARVVTIDPDAIDHQMLAPADLIVIDHCGKLSDEVVTLLGGLLRRGRPILYVAGELIDASNLQRLIDAAGDGLKMPVQFVPPAGDRDRSDLFLASVRADRVPFRVFGDDLNKITGPLRFTGGLSTRRLDEGLSDDVLATYGDGSAFLVLTAADLGTLAVVNADLERSMLPTTGAFLPLVEELVQAMLQRHGRDEPLVCGEPLVAQLPAEVTGVAGLRIAPPGGAERAGDARTAMVGADDDDATVGKWGRLREESTGVIWAWASPDRPGAYRIVRDDTTVMATSIVLPDDESPLEALAPQVLEQRLGAGRDVAFRSAQSVQDDTDSLWTWLLVGCVVFLLAELIALIGFRT